ncbi:hypothetical protein [Azospirillum sp. B2RO_4]|uniref:hypothetical protein n=1 Tax=Azospirillum sp. B2RO_4 TaxID=3027796 RepID=UPI003DA9266E
MATTWTLKCVSGNDVATLAIVDSLNPLPGSDTWRGVEGAGVWGDPTQGSVANWATGRTLLHAGAATVVHSLENFGKQTGVGASGAGDKAPTGGSFPDGAFTWTCTKRE